VYWREPVQAIADAAAVPDNAPLPLFIFAHGGLWRAGSRREGAELCRNLVATSPEPIMCATVDYTLTGELGGCCPTGATLDLNCNQAAAQEQALQLIKARNFFVEEFGVVAVDGRKVFFGGHSAGAHLSAWLGIQWGELTTLAGATEAIPSPLGIVGNSGIYDIALFDEYDRTRWNGGFQCTTRLAFGHTTESFAAGSPTALAASMKPVARFFAIHSPRDDWVQASQAVLLDEVLEDVQGALDHQLDIEGLCVSGQHQSTISGRSAATLAGCIADFMMETLQHSTRVHEALVNTTASR